MTKVQQSGEKPAKSKEPENAPERRRSLLPVSAAVGVRTTKDRRPRSEPREEAQLWVRRKRRNTVPRSTEAVRLAGWDKSGTEAAYQRSRRFIIVGVVGVTVAITIIFIVFSFLKSHREDSIMYKMYVKEYYREKNRD